MSPPTLYRPGFASYSVKFSPFVPDRLAIATAQYYGVVGNGRLEIVELGPQGARGVREFLTKDGCFDVAWSEANQNLACVGTGNGCLKIFDVSRPSNSQPVLSFDGHHKAEVYGVDWNINAKELVCSASWDKTVAVWNVAQGILVKSLQTHQRLCYGAVFSPHNPNRLASVSGDSFLHIHDLSAPPGPPAISVAAHPGHEVLAVDWFKYNDYTLATVGVDRCVNVWDLRNVSKPAVTLRGHQLAVRRVKYHPHNPRLLLSAGYDMSVRVFDVVEGKQLDCFDHHSEFVIGLDLSLFQENLVASAGWDRSVWIWNHSPSFPRPPVPLPAARGKVRPPGIAPTTDVNVFP